MVTIFFVEKTKIYLLNSIRNEEGSRKINVELYYYYTGTFLNV